MDGWMDRNEQKTTDRDNFFFPLIILYRLIRPVGIKSIQRTHLKEEDEQQQQKITKGLNKTKQNIQRLGQKTEWTAVSSERDDISISLNSARSLERDREG